MLGLANRGVRRALAAGAALGLLFTATGCLRMELGLEVRPDDTVGGTLTAAWSEEFLEEISTGDDALDQAQLDAFLDALLEGVPDADRAPYREGGFVGETATFTGRPLSEFAEFGGDEWGYLRINHEGRQYDLEGYWDLRVESFINPVALEDVEVVISVNFPAKITAHNGELDGRTVTWRMTPGDDYELTAEAREYNGWMWALVGTASVVVVCALLWLWQWTRMRRHSIGAAR